MELSTRGGGETTVSVQKLQHTASVCVRMYVCVVRARLDNWLRGLMLTP